MKQYCRYCHNAILQDENLFYCLAFKCIYETKKAKVVNHCSNFDFISIDLFDPDKYYTEEYDTQDYEQTKLY